MSDVLLNKIHNVSTYGTIKELILDASVKDLNFHVKTRSMRLGPFWCIVVYSPNDDPDKQRMFYIEKPYWLKKDNYYD
jgi:hypothetical protein